MNLNLHVETLVEASSLTEFVPIWQGKWKNLEECPKAKVKCLFFLDI